MPELLDVVGRIESFDTDIATIAARAGLGDLQLRHLNRSARDVGRYAVHYDDDTAGLVAEMYDDDIARFGYRFAG